MTLSSAIPATITRKTAAVLMAASVVLGAAGATVATGASPTDCHVGPAAGAYTCSFAVVVDAPATPTPAPSATPSPTVTPTPTPTATPVPTPSPTPVPTATPTPSPTAAAGIPVPASIDATGHSDVAVSLAAFINGLAPNTTVQFKAGAIYAVASAVKIGGRTNLDLEGNGATIKSIAPASGFNENFSEFYFQTFPGTNTGISIRGFKLIGSDPNPGTFVGGKEGQMGILVDGGNGFDISGNTFSANWGDGVEVNSNATNVRVHGNTITSTGRNAISVIWGNHVEFDHNVITAVGYLPFDVEPNTASEPCSFINLHDNAAGTWGDAFFALDGSHTGAAIHDVSVVNNTETGKSLLAIVNNGGTGRNQNIVFTGNTSNVSASGPVLQFAHVDGLTVTGNVQPLSGGALLSITDSTNVVHQ